MKNEEDEAFDELARRQGAWGGGYRAKRAAAADKLQEEDWDVIAEKQLASIKRDTRASFEDAVVRATHKVMSEFEAQPVQEPLHIVQSNGRHSPLLTHMMSKRTTPPVAPVQEPTGMLHIDRLGQWLDASIKERKRPWAGLTDDELADLWYKESLDWMEFARAHEAALKEKNT